MTAPFRAAGAVVAAIILLAMTWASTAPLSIAPSTRAVVRVSLGARPERIERCRTVTDAELAKIAPQMRQQVICEGTTARYTLEIRRNDTVLHSQLVRGGGLRHDRQLYVSRDIPVAPGQATYRVDLVRLDRASSGGVARDTAERRRRREQAIPPALRLDIEATLAPREVLLVTYDPGRRRLISRSGASGER